MKKTKIKRREEKLALILFAISILKKPIITKIQKTLFIFVQEYDNNLLLYEPNNYGPNSFELMDEMNFLINHNLISLKRKGIYDVYEIEKEGSQKIKTLKSIERYKHKFLILEEIIKFFNKIDYKKFIAYIYVNYPKYTEKSIIYDEIMNKVNHDEINEIKKAFLKLKKENGI